MIADTAPDYGDVLLLLNSLATATMAASAAVQAVRTGFDVIGAMCLAAVTAVGGGTLRDLLIGRTPVFWLTEPMWLYNAVPVGAVTWLFVQRMQVGTGRRLKLLAYLDAVGLALFTLTGLRVALGIGLDPAFAVLLGCITGVGGGLFRDVLCGIRPIVLTRDIYATLSLAGGALYIVLDGHVGPDIATLIAFAAIAVSRMVVVAVSDPFRDALSRGFAER